MNIKCILYSSLLILVLIVRTSGAPSIRSSNFQDDFNTDQVPSGQGGMWSFLKSFIANILASISSMLAANQQASETDPNSMTPRPIVSVLNTLVEALRGGSASRLIESIIDQFNQLVGRIGRMYSDGVEREVYVFDSIPAKVDPKDRLVLNKLITKMKLTQSSIEKLTTNETELSSVQEKIKSIKSDLNEIWSNLKNMYSDYNIKSTNVSYVLDRTDFMDPKKMKLTASELQTQLNKLWRDLSRNLMQTIDRLDMRVKRLTKQTLRDGQHLNEEADLIENNLQNRLTHQSAVFVDSINDQLLSPKERWNTKNSTGFNLLESSSKRLEHLNKLSDQLTSHSNLRVEDAPKKLKNQLDTSVLDNEKADNVPLNRYLRSVERLQMESEKLFSGGLENLIPKSSNSKAAKLQMQNETENDDSSSDKNDSNSSNESSSNDSSDLPIDLPIEPDIQNESQLRKFTNMLRSQFNESINQFTNYWKSLNHKIGEKRKNFNATAGGRKLNLDPFGWRKKPTDDDQDSFDGSDQVLDDYSDYAPNHYFSLNDC